MPEVITREKMWTSFAAGLGYLFAWSLFCNVSTGIFSEYILFFVFRLNQFFYACEWNEEGKEDVENRTSSLWRKGSVLRI